MNSQKIWAILYSISMAFLPEYHARLVIKKFYENELTVRRLALEIIHALFLSSLVCALILLYYLG